MRRQHLVTDFPKQSMRVWEHVVSAVSVSVILGGSLYGYRRESLLRTDLHEVYQQINREHFDGQLRDCAIVWDRLDHKFGEVIFDDYSCRIRIDRYENRTLSQLEGTIAHEACHRFVGFVPDAESHGTKFHECMHGFE
jgi:hypothetical protein